MAIGTIYAEFDVDFTKFERNQQKLLQSAVSTSLSVEKNWQTLGVKSDKIFQAMRLSIQNSFDMIKNHAGTTQSEMVRAQEAFSRKMKAIDEEQFGKRTSLLEGFKKNWLAAAAIMAGVTWAGIKIWDMAKVGAGFDEQIGILDNLAKKYRTTADTIISEMDRASKYQIAQSELMSIALGGIAKGLTPEQLINLANAAETLGDVVGKTATEALKELTEALETGRARGLKNYLGTALDLEAAFGDLAKKMTDAEKAQAMYNITMLAAIDIQSQQNQELDDAADKIAEVEKRFDDATLAVSRFFKGLVVGILSVPSNWNKQVEASGIDLLTGLPIPQGAQPSDYAAGPGWAPGASEKAAAKHQEQIDKLKEQLKARKDLTEAEAKAKKEAEEAARKAQAFANEQQKAYQKAYESQAKLMAQGYYDDLADGEKEATKQLERLADEQIKFGKESEKVFENIAKKNEEATRKMEKDWEHFWENVQDFTADTFYDLFSNIGDGWSNLLDRMKEWFMKWVAEIAAKQVVIQLQGAMGGSSSSGGGILSQLMSLGGTASSGYSTFTGNSMFSSLGGLLGGGGAIQGGLTGTGAGGMEALLGSSYSGAGTGAMGGAGAAGMAGGAAIVALAAGIMLKARLKKSEDKFWSGALQSAFPSSWTMGQGLSSGSGDYARSTGVSWNQNDWWNDMANSFVGAANEVIKAFNANMRSFLKSLPEDFAGALEQLLAKQNWSIAGLGNLGAHWPEHEMERYISEALQNIANKFSQTVAAIIQQGTGMTMDQFSVFMQMRGQLQNSWESFVMGLKTSDLAPVQSMETFSYYYKSLMDKVKANPGDMNAANALMQYTSGTYLPFTKGYMENQGDYASIFNSIISQSGEMYNTVFSGINDKFDQLFDYVKELLDRPIEVTVNLNGNTIAEAVAVAVSQGNVSWDTPYAPAGTPGIDPPSTWGGGP